VTRLATEVRPRYIDVNLSTKVENFHEYIMQLYHQRENIDVWIYCRYASMVTYEVAHIFMKVVSKLTAKNIIKK
jgi:hypothetical protein